MVESNRYQAEGYVRDESSLRLDDIPVCKALQALLLINLQRLDTDKRNKNSLLISDWMLLTRLCPVPFILFPHNNVFS